MAIKLGKAKHESKITLKDFQKAPIWMKPHGDDGWMLLRPVLGRNPDVTAEIIANCNYPTILCTVLDHPKLFAQAWYSKKERSLSMLRFSHGGEWIKAKDFKLRRPLTIVAVPKLEGEADVEFYLLTKNDLYAARVGGTLFRNAGPDKLRRLKLGAGMVPTRVRAKASRRTSTSTSSRTSGRSAARRDGPVKLTGAKLGPLVDGAKVTIKDRIKHPVWVSTYEEDAADEDAQRAVISRDPNVSSEVLRKFLVATLTFKVGGTEVCGIAAYDRDSDALSSLSFWTGKRWEGVVPKRLSFPLTLEPQCRILGKRGVQFILKKRGDCSARRVAR